MRTQISLTIDEKIVCEIDSKRGLVTRSRYFEKLLNYAIENMPRIKTSV
jgi:metal-responsive CopG/Arc/MetJ family transcriptional regulator